MSVSNYWDGEDSASKPREEADGPYSHKYADRSDGRTSFAGRQWNVIDAIKGPGPERLNRADSPNSTCKENQATSGADREREKRNPMTPSINGKEEDSSGRGFDKERGAEVPKKKRAGEAGGSRREE